MTTFTEIISLTQINCGECGGTYAINERYREQRHKQGGFWTCPYCKCSWGYVQSENTRLKKQIEDRERELRESKCEALRQQQLREQEQLERAKVERKLRRVNKGVCPCCNRSFQNLQRHMAAKHAEKK